MTARNRNAALTATITALAATAPRCALRSTIARTAARRTLLVAATTDGRMRSPTGVGNSENVRTT
jgi:hypothetical protein